MKGLEGVLFSLYNEITTAAGREQWAGAAQLKQVGLLLLLLSSQAQMCNHSSAGLLVPLLLVAAFNFLNQWLINHPKAKESVPFNDLS